MKVRISGRKYPRRSAWKALCGLALKRAKNKCEVTGSYSALTVDHIFPERFVRFHLKANPHVVSNVIVLNRTEHGVKTGIDRLLWKGPDFLTFISRLNARGWPMDRVAAAFKAYGLYYQEPS